MYFVFLSGKWRTYFLRIFYLTIFPDGIFLPFIVKSWRLKNNIVNKEVQLCYLPSRESFGLTSQCALKLPYFRLIMPYLTALVFPQRVIKISVEIPVGIEILMWKSNRDGFWCANFYIEFLIGMKALLISHWGWKCRLFYPDEREILYTKYWPNFPVGLGTVFSTSITYFFSLQFN